uniref:Uncharacterized protein n=1 Tax=Anguilla anguilla TaxID=7936 RepID=A0A0E9WM53_ANGAN
MKNEQLVEIPRLQMWLEQRTAYTGVSWDQGWEITSVEGTHSHLSWLLYYKGLPFLRLLLRDFLKELLVNVQQSHYNTPSQSSSCWYKSTLHSRHFSSLLLHKDSWSHFSSPSLPSGLRFNLFSSSTPCQICGPVSLLYKRHSLVSILSHCHIRFNVLFGVF